MAQDVKLLKGTDGIFDIPISGTEFESVSGVETAILVTVFTEARSDSDTIPDAFNRRGWVGNLLTLEEGYELGSLLWTLSQARLTQNTLNTASDTVKKALNWMIEDGIADTIEVDTVVVSNRTANINIDLFKDLNMVGRYTTVWNNTQEQ
jgi:phage gp46-like protein